MLSKNKLSLLPHLRCPSSFVLTTRVKLQRIAKRLMFSGNCVAVSLRRFWRVGPVTQKSMRVRIGKSIYRVSSKRSKLVKSVSFVNHVKCLGVTFDAGNLHSSDRRVYSVLKNVGLGDIIKLSFDNFVIRSIMTYAFPAWLRNFC